MRLPGVLLSLSLAPPEPDGRWALLVGADERERRARTRDERYTAEDARALGEALVRAGYDPDRVIVMTPDARRRLRPTRGNILAQLAAMEQVAGAESFLFFFSGQGGALSWSGGGDYLFPLGVDVDAGPQGAIDLEELRRRLDRVPAPRKLAILDGRGDWHSAGCFSYVGPWQGHPDPGAAGTPFLYLNDLRGRGSEEDAAAGLGLGTSALLAGLAGEVDGIEAADGAVTAGELMAYLRANLAARAGEGYAWHRPGWDGDWSALAGPLFPAGAPHRGASAAPPYLPLLASEQRAYRAALLASAPPAMRAYLALEIRYPPELDRQAAIDAALGAALDAKIAALAEAEAALAEPIGSADPAVAAPALALLAAAYEDVERAFAASSVPAYLTEDQAEIYRASLADAPLVYSHRLRAFAAYRALIERARGRDPAGHARDPHVRYAAERLLSDPRVPCEDLPDPVFQRACLAERERREAAAERSAAGRLRELRERIAALEAAVAPYRGCPGFRESGPLAAAEALLEQARPVLEAEEAAMAEEILPFFDEILPRIGEMDPRCP